MVIILENKKINDKHFVYQFNFDKNHQCLLTSDQQSPQILSLDKWLSIDQWIEIYDELDKHWILQKNINKSTSGKFDCAAADDPKNISIDKNRLILIVKFKTITRELKQILNLINENVYDKYLHVTIKTCTKFDSLLQTLNDKLVKLNSIKPDIDDGSNENKVDNDDVNSNLTIDDHAKNDNNENKLKSIYNLDGLNDHEEYIPSVVSNGQTTPEIVYQPQKATEKSITEEYTPKSTELLFDDFTPIKYTPRKRKSSINTQSLGERLSDETDNLIEMSKNTCDSLQSPTRLRSSNGLKKFKIDNQTTDNGNGILSKQENSNTTNGGNRNPDIEQISTVNAALDQNVKYKKKKSKQSLFGDDPHEDEDDEVVNVPDDATYDKNNNDKDKIKLKPRELECLEINKKRSSSSSSSSLNKNNHKKKYENPPESTFRSKRSNDIGKQKTKITRSSSSSSTASTNHQKTPTRDLSGWLIKTKPILSSSSSSTTTTNHFKNINNRTAVIELKDYKSRSSSHENDKNNCIITSTPRKEIIDCEADDDDKELHYDRENVKIINDDTEKLLTKEQQKKLIEENEKQVSITTKYIENLKKLMPSQSNEIMEIKDLKYMSNDCIKKTFDEHKPLLKKLFKQYHRTATKFKPQLILDTVLSESQRLFMAKIIQNYFYDSKRYGNYGSSDCLFGLLVPEWGLAIFQNIYKLSREDSIKRIAIQFDCNDEILEGESF